ncbi:hypothetical protein AB0H43_03150 [Hamadaea sp. NPDC050747]|uniref:hypothetical protein n=1 Tax=Hamadaea sp. NPDC050747 TaxID=3155789 RepID=UPI0033EB44B1
MSTFDAIWEAPVQHIETDAEEVELIEAAKGGDETATLRLLASYMPQLRRAVGHYTRALSLDDARQSALLGFMSAIKAHDVSKSTRLTSILRHHLDAALSEDADQANGSGFTVPGRTLDRWRGIVAAAGGDFSAAAKLAPSHAMTEETFWTVFSALYRSNSLQALNVGDGSEPVSLVAPREIADAEDRVLVDLAFSSVDAIETLVISLAYGFGDEDPVPDAEIGHRHGFSRLKTLRTRQRALTKMRSALGVDALVA